MAVYVKTSRRSKAYVRRGGSLGRTRGNKALLTWGQTNKALMKTGPLTESDRECDVSP